MNIRANLGLQKQPLALKPRFPDILALLSSAGLFYANGGLFPIPNRPQPQAVKHKRSLDHPPRHNADNSDQANQKYQVG